MLQAAFLSPWLLNPMLSTNPYENQRRSKDPWPAADW